MWLHDLLRRLSRRIDWLWLVPALDGITRTSKHSSVTVPSVIAIDGPVASGKSVVGRRIARRLRYRFIDTGLMYRACTLIALRTGVPISDSAALGTMAGGLHMNMLATPDGEHLEVNDEDVTAELRIPDVERFVSDVAKVPAVRAAMVAQQRRLAEEGAVVMVGRDIGSKVLPDAAKIYLDASVDVRVHRRLAELAGKATAAEVRENLEMRDRIDSQRADSPLLVTDDAIVVNTDNLGIEEVVTEIIRLVER